jgi:minor extracellular serine protease Vpr
MQPASPRRKLAILAATGSAMALTALGSVTALAAPSTPATIAGAPSASADASTPTGTDTSSAIVGLSYKPLALDPLTAPKHGKKIAWGSSSVKSERAKLAAQRNAFKQWLRYAAPKAKVTGEYDVALNAVAIRLNGTRLAILMSGPNVISAGYQATYAPTSDDPDLALIDGELGWAAANPGSPSDAGHGIKVGVVDSGIDVTHPCFDDAGFPATTQLGNKAFTNNKVIVAKVFANKAANLGYTAEAVQEHGTHVAGTIACDAGTLADVDGAAIPYDPSGVAPGAQLGSYNVFPGDITSARSEDILNALQAAARDGMDVINMSLGGDTHGIQDLVTFAVDNLDRANIVVAISAGNAGPGHFTVGAPGSAERALTAGASSVGHYVGTPITAGGNTVAVAAPSDFTRLTGDLSGTLAASGSAASLSTGCVDGTYTNATGAIALVSRGVCTFGTKVAMAEKAGAVGVIVVNNVAGDPVAMATDPAFTTSIPAVQVALADKATMTGLVGQTVTIGVHPAYVDSGNDDIMAAFSSQGPTDVSYRVKPDLVAPGVNVLSSIPHQFCDAGPAGCWAFFQGTSMASPHLAGTAAVVRQAHPNWDAWQVRSAITNTAKEGVLTKFNAITTPDTDPLITGAGLDDVDAAVGAQLALSSVSTSFGAIPAGNGAAQHRTLTITNLTGTPITVPVSVDGAAFSTSASSLTVPASGSASLTVTFHVPAGSAGDNSGTLRLGNLAHSVLYAFLR